MWRLLTETVCCWRYQVAVLTSEGCYCGNWRSGGGLNTSSKGGERERRRRWECSASIQYMILDSAAAAMMVHVWHSFISPLLSSPLWAGQVQFSSFPSPQSACVRCEGFRCKTACRYCLKIPFYLCFNTFIQFVQFCMFCIMQEFFSNDFFAWCWNSWLFFPPHLHIIENKNSIYNNEKKCVNPDYILKCTIRKKNFCTSSLFNGHLSCNMRI